MFFPKLIESLFPAFTLSSSTKFPETTITKSSGQTMNHIVKIVVQLVVALTLLFSVSVTARPENNNAELLNGQFYDEVKQLLDKKLEENNQIEVIIDLWVP
jgi:hypothetical protein